MLPFTGASPQPETPYTKGGRASRSRRLAVLLASLILLGCVLLLPAVAGAAPATTPNLITGAGTQIASFDSASGWQVAGGAEAVDTSRFREGVGSLLVTPTDVHSTACVQKTMTVDMSAGGSIRFWVYFSGDPGATIFQLRLLFSPMMASSPSEWLQRFLFRDIPVWTLHQGWNLLSLNKGDFGEYHGSGYSAPTFAEQMNTIRFEITPLVTDTEVPSLRLDDFRYGVVSTPAVVLSFKNNSAGQLANAKPVLDAHDWKATEYIYVNEIGVGGCLSLTDLRTLDTAGWDIANGTASHTLLTGMSLANATKAIADGSNYLTTNGMTRAAQYVAYPDGLYDATVQHAMHDAGAKTGLAGNYASPAMLPMDDPYVIPSYDAGYWVNYNHGLAQTEALIDQAMSSGGVIQLVFHDILPTSTDGYTMTTADFTALCDYIAAKDINVLTISQLYGLNSDARGPLENDQWPPITTSHSSVVGGQTTVTLTATDAISGVDKTYYKVGTASDYTMYAGPFTMDPAQSLTFYSVDKAGNSETPVTTTDAQAPTTTAGGVTNGWANGHGGLVLTATDAGSGVKEIDYSLDGGATWTTTPGSKVTVPVATEGPNTLTFHSVDNAGNTEADTTIPLQIENEGPISALTGADNALHNGPVTLTISAVDAAGTYVSGLKSISYRIDSGTPVETAGPGPVQAVIGDGNHSVAYWSTDNAGNVEAERSVYVRVAAPLPPNLIKNLGTQVSAFDQTSDWTMSYLGTEAVDTTVFKEGSGSLQLTTTASTDPWNDRVYIAKDVDLDMSSMLNGGTVRFWMYLNPDWHSTLAEIHLTLATAASGMDGGFFYRNAALGGMHQGWNLISLSRSNFTSGTAASWSAPIVKVRFELWPFGGQTASIKLDDLRCGVVATPAVVFCFDDALASVGANAKPIMDQRGIVGTVYADQADIGTDEYSTWAALQSLYGAGWDIGNHTLDHVDLHDPLLTLEQIKAQLSGFTDQLHAHGLDRARYDVAYPLGEYSSMVIQAMAETGMRTGRMASYRPLALPLDEPYLLPACSTADSVGALPLALIEQRIDEAVADGAVIPLLFHGVGPVNDPTYQMSTEEFTQICDYIASRGIPSLTISQLAALSQDPATGDFTAPVTTDNVPADWQKTSPVAVHLTANDNVGGSGLAQTQYSLDGGVNWLVGTDFSVSAQGTTTIKYRSADVAGNLEATVSKDVKIDSAAPATAAAASPAPNAAGWNNTDVTVTLTGSDPTPGSGLVAAPAGTFYTIDGGTQQSYTAPLTFTTEGQPLISLWSTDAAGNTETPAGSLQVKIDKTAPLTTAVVGAGQNPGEAVLTLTATDTGGSNVAKTYYKLNTATEFTEYSAPVTVTAATSVTFYSVDVASNSEADKTVPISIDATPPVTKITEALPTGWQKTAPVVLHLTASDADAGVKSTSYSTNGGSTWTTATAWPVEVQLSAQGTNTLKYYSTDLANNVEAIQTATVQIDSIAPTGTAAATPAAWTTGNASVRFSASDPGGSGLVTSSATCAVDGVPVTYTYGSSVSITTEGDHAVVFTIKDVAGNMATVTAHAKIDRSAPTASAAATPSTWTNSPAGVSIALTATDAFSGINQATVSYSLDGGARQPITWGTPVVVTTAGTHTVSFRVADVVGNTATVSATARIDRTAPATTCSYNSSLWQKANVGLRFTATEAGGSGLAATEWSTNGTLWTRGSSATVSTEGVTTVYYRSLDNAGNVEDPAKTVVVRIDKTAPTVVVVAPLRDGTYVRNQAVAVSWTATDLFSGINPLPSYTGSTPPNGDPLVTSSYGSKTFSVKATDNAGNTVTVPANYSVPFASPGVLDIAPDGSSQFVIGTPVPVSFVLTNSAGGAYNSAKPKLLIAQRQGDGSWGAEQAAAPVSGSGNQFTYGSAGKYSFNWSTAGLAAGTWQLHIDLGKGGAIYARLVLH